MNPNLLRKLGWQPFFDQQVTADETNNLITARVCAHHGSHILFLTPTDEHPPSSVSRGTSKCNQEFVELSVPSSLIDAADITDTDSNSVGRVAVGDWLLLSPDDHRALRRLTRKTVLHRKAAGETVKPQLIAANVDTVFIVSSCNQDFNLSRLERYLALVLESEATPVIILTKADVCDDPAELCQLAQSLHPGLVVETLDARDPLQAEVLDQWCQTGKTIALLGSSGVGKSTLANTLGGLSLATNEIRIHDAKGRHTTTARSMHRLAAGGWLIDNPGMRELQLADCEQGVADLFEDVVKLAEQCKFRNCNHTGDAGCALESAVESGEVDQRRMSNYLKLQAEQARNSATLAERRDRDRKTGKLYKTIIAEKRNRRGGPK